MRFPNVKTTLLALAALAAVFQPSVPSKAAPDVTATCPLNSTALKVSNVPTATTVSGSGRFIDVPESNVRFIQGGTRAGCIVVTLSAEAFTGANEAMLVRAVLDGATLCHPNEVFLGITTSSTSLVGGAVNYVCTGIQPGPHTIKMQFSSRFGTTVRLDRRTVSVRHFR